MAEYPVRQLFELASDEPGAIAIGPFGSRMKADMYVPQGVPVIRGTNIGQDRSLEGEWVFVTDSFADGIANCVVKPGDLVFPHRGSIGEVALIEERHGRMVLSTSMMKFRADPQKANSEFLYYFFRSTAGRDEIMRFGSQVGTPGIGQPLTSLRQFRTPLPPLQIQTAIAELLGSLDDKIELNRRTSETLEGMAHAIFRDWFIDFGPTRRRIEGASDLLNILGGFVTDPERASVLADLFPPTLGDDGLPNGWDFGRVENLMELAYGKSLTKENRRDGPFPVYGSGGVTGCHDEALVKGPSVIVGRKGTVGSVYWEDRDFVPIDTVFYVKSSLPMTFCYYLLQTLGLDGMNTDAAVPGLNRSNVYRLEVPVAPPELVRAFGEIAGLLRHKVAANDAEIRTLTSTRDFLLPRLISGDVRVRTLTASS
ncbi:restriction endonuclease subunit S [Mesorhizobium sp.]|uniref:restriction endonuclease subunit S n=1 Tax=Mesorhizobium sp. TaxID=1871066 RepID=UPI0012124156|nr:restriction endonuclease subunit S [Mesorhizobium sp.]TIS65602.1 MAG: restriction endonuclease subunit S [Mesorhizobium sp.]